MMIRRIIGPYALVVCCISGGCTARSHNSHDPESDPSSPPTSEARPDSKDAPHKEAIKKSDREFQQADVARLAAAVKRKANDLGLSAPGEPSTLCMRPDVAAALIVGLTIDRPCVGGLIEGSALEAAVQREYCASSPEDKESKGGAMVAAIADATFSQASQSAACWSE